MTDFELLELAAKAAGREPCEYDRRYWNPLADDGDALRLAVTLDMNIFHAAKSAFALPSDDDGTYQMQVSYTDAGGDKNAATRRAIVRAAAEIGKELV